MVSKTSSLKNPLFAIMGFMRSRIIILQLLLVIEFLWFMIALVIGSNSLLRS